MHTRPEEICPPRPLRKGIDLMREALERLRTHDGETELVRDLDTYLAVVSPSARPGAKP